MPRVNRALPRLQREARRKRVADALISGKNYRQIAQELDISLGTISADVRTVLKRWQADQVQAIDQWLLIQLRQLDALTAGIWPKAKSGDYAAIDRMLAIMDPRLCTFRPGSLKRRNG